MILGFSKSSVSTQVTSKNWMREMRFWTFGPLKTMNNYQKPFEFDVGEAKK